MLATSLYCLMKMFIVQKTSLRGSYNRHNITHVLAFKKCVDSTEFAIRLLYSLLKPENEINLNHMCDTHLEIRSIEKTLIQLEYN